MEKVPSKESEQMAVPGPDLDVGNCAQEMELGYGAVACGSNAVGDGMAGEGHVVPVID